MRRTSLHVWFAVCVGALALACTDKAPTNSGNTSDTGGNADGSTTNDNDGDGHDSVESGGDDCNDDDASVNPDASESCDGVDNDCDGEVDEGVSTTYYADADNDGFGDPDVAMDACEALAGYVPNPDDCNDADSTIHPDAEELCDGLDNDCDDSIDEDLSSATWYVDADGDGYGDPDSPVVACAQPDGTVGNALDCVDTDAGEPVHVSNSGPIPGSGIEGWDTGDTWGPWDTNDTATSGPLGSRGNPYTTIQEGVDASDDCVYVYTGTYNEDVTLTKDLLVLGINGADDTTIQGTGSGPTVTIDGVSSDGVLQGFTITGGRGKQEITTDTESCGSDATCTVTTTSYWGGCLYVNSSQVALTELVVQKCVLPDYSYESDESGNVTVTYSGGGGALLQASSPQVTDVVFRANSADNGGGVLVRDNGSPTFSHVLFDGNTSSSGGGVATQDSSPAFSNSIFANNVASGSGSGTGGAAVEVAGGVFTANFVTGVGNTGASSVYLGGSASSAVVNTIFQANSSGYLIDGDGSGTSSFSYNDIYNAAGSGAFSSAIIDPTGSLGNISADAMFVAFTDDGSYSDDNLHLSAGSPAENTGSPADTDADGSAADMGAYGGASGNW